MDNLKPTCITGSPCGDPTCYRGGVGDWNYQFKDGPCAAPDCAWPKGLPARPHFTDTPATPIVDAGKAALQMQAITEPMTRPPAVSPQRLHEQRGADQAADVHAEQIRAAVDRYILSTLWLT